jgi:hypothetical protein
MPPQNFLRQGYGSYLPQQQESTSNATHQTKGCGVRGEHR